MPNHFSYIESLSGHRASAIAMDEPVKDRATLESESVTAHQGVSHDLMSDGTQKLMGDFCFVGGYGLVGYCRHFVCFDSLVDSLLVQVFCKRLNCEIYEKDCVLTTEIDHRNDGSFDGAQIRTWEYYGYGSTISVVSTVLYLSLRAPCTRNYRREREERVSNSLERLKCAINFIRYFPNGHKKWMTTRTLKSR